MINSVSRNGKIVFIFFLAAGLFMPSASIASDLKSCMVEILDQADDSVTIGELRLECEK